MIYELVVYRPLALKEVKVAVNWYEAEQEGRGLKFLQYLEEKLQYLCRHAESYPIVKRNYREFVIG